MRRHTIVLVDDDAQFIRLMELVLSEAGYMTVSLSGPDATVNQIRDARPDLMMLDIGFHDPASKQHLLERLRGVEATAQTPIIVCTTLTALSESVSDRLQAAKCAILFKPFMMEDMLALVEECLQDAAD